MKSRIFICILICCLQSFNLPADEDLVPDGFMKEDLQIPSVSYDESLYQSFKKDGSYDYYQVKQQGQSFFDAISDRILRWLNRNVNPSITSKQLNGGLWVITILVVIILVVILFIYKPSLFYINRKKNADLEEMEETIEGYDFNALIAIACAEKQFSAAIRWKYLQVLKAMNDTQLIEWEPFKTVNEYVYELKRTDIRENFRLLSLHFLYYRYGNFEATENDFEEFRRLGSEITNRL